MKKYFEINYAKNAIACLIIITMLLSTELHAEQNNQGKGRQSRLIKHLFSKFVKIEPKSNCFTGLKELEDKIKQSEGKLLSVIKLFRQLAITAEILLKRSNKTCDGGEGSVNISFAPDNSIDNDNSNKIVNEDIFRINNPGDNNIYNITVPATNTASDPTTSPPNMTTASTAMTTVTTTPPRNKTQPMCYDIGHIIQDWPLDEFYTVKTILPLNTPKLCAKFCLILEYKYSAVNNGDFCYCSNIDLPPADKAHPAYCNVLCPGDYYIFCGGSEMKYVTYLPTNVCTIEEAVSMLPSGVCRRVFLRYDEVNFPLSEVFSDNTPARCKMFCMIMGYKWACAHKGTTCGCEESRPDILQDSQESCDVPCPGDDLLTCGSATDSANCFPTGI